MKKCFRVISFAIIVSMLLQFVPMSEVAAASSDAGEVNTTPFPINYDPNEGLVHYGFYGDMDDIGMRVENDLNNVNIEQKETVEFPDDLIGLKDANGADMFPGYDPTNAYYDYTDMLNHALEIARARGNIKVHVNPGVYYFTGSIPLHNYTPIDGEAGKTAFVVKPNFIDRYGQECEEYGFFTVDNIKERYSWYYSSISDLTIVVEGTHPSFKPTSTYDEIYANILSDDIQATDKYSLFYHIRIGYGGIYNNAAAGFYSYFRGSFVDMLTKVQNNTFGPCRDAIYGCDTNDAMFANNIFYGGYFTDEEGLQRMPTFMTTFNTGTTTFTNSYISNFHLARTGAGCWAPHASYSNVTFERVLNICVDTTAKANIAMSGCHLLNCTRTDVERYFESFGYEEHDPHWENGKWTTDGNGYMIFQSLSKYNKRNDYEKEQEAHMFRAGSMSISQCLIECDSLENTILFHMDDSEWESRYTNERKASKCLTFTDNAFKIRDWKYENLLKIDWRDESVFTEETLKNGFKDYTWIEDYKPVEKDVPIAWTEGMKLISTELEWYLDFGAFASPNVPTNGYRARGITQIGADEDTLRETMRDRYYNDLKSGREVVYASDFGAINYDHSDNKNALQTAFDYAATHDAILYIEPGTYYVQDSIVLRGGKTYRIVCDGEIVVNGNSYIANEGLFVMDKDDNAPINGYYIGVYMSVHGSDGSAFYNVNMKDMYLKIRSVQRGQSAFHNCHLEDCYITDGQMQFSQYGWFWNSTVKNTLITNVYGTGSTGYEGEDGITPGDISYQFLISSSDLINTTMRANWLEFLQFSNGKKITGEGNSLYRGNLIDYSYNYSFGRNDVVVGNTLSRGGYPAIVDHMLHSNFPIDLPDALTDYMVLFHVSDGLQLIGNADVTTLNAKTHFVEFDSPTIKYKDASGNTVSSISNARVAGNLTRAERKTGNVAGTVDYGIGEDVVLENCLNNQLELQMFWQGDTKPDTDKVDENAVWKKSIPGVEACVNGERISVTIDALKSKGLTNSTTAKNLTPIVKNPHPQDKDYDVENVWEQNTSTTTYELIDFRERTDEELAILKQQAAGLIAPDTIQIYRGMEYDGGTSDNIYNKADLNPNDGVDKKEGFREQDITPENRAYIYSQCVQYDIRENVIGKDAFYMYQKDIEDVRKRHEDAPTYAIVLSEQKGDILQGVKAGIYQEMGLGESYKRKPAIIYAEDATHYYGILVAYDCTLNNSNNRGIYIYPGTLKKNPATGKEGRLADAGNTGWTWGDRRQLSMQDLGSLESYYGRVCGDYTEQLMFEGDPSKFASDILGVEFELDYEDAYELVSITAVFDFTGIGTDDAGQKATLRRVNLGSFSVKDLDKVFGLWGGDETWVNYVQAEVMGQTPCTEGVHTFEDVTIQEATCISKGIVRHECTQCDYEYLSEIKVKKHDFTVTQEPLEEGEKGFYSKVTFTCKNCDFAYVENQLIIVHLCNHKITDIIQEQEATCETAGFKVYKCKASDCGEEWSESIEALGHDYVETVVKPTTTEQGYTLYVCSRCQNSYKDNYSDPIKKEDVTLCFTDIPSNAWYVKAVQYVYDNDIMAGKGDVFCPNNPITREEFVQVLYNQSGKPAVAIENRFPDVKDAWYKNAVLWADDNDIANGKGNGMFGVGENISRQDLALMLYKYARLKGFDLTVNTGEINKYADGNKVSGYAKEAMDWAITQGIMSGKGNKGEDISTYRLDPLGTATRAECASMMMKLLEK